jgi:hypothetical protein
MSLYLKAIRSEIDSLREDSARLEWLTSVLFDRHWDGGIGKLPTWRIVSNYRHVMHHMKGDTMREAIDVAIRELSEQEIIDIAENGPHEGYSPPASSWEFDRPDLIEFAHRIAAQERKACAVLAKDMTEHGWSVLDIAEAISKRDGE